jgi:hypothetical protein
MFVGVGIAFIQALTQVQEMTLTFVPKIVAILITVAYPPLCRRADLHLHQHRLPAHRIRILGQIQRELEPVFRPELRETKGQGISGNSALTANVPDGAGGRVAVMACAPAWIVGMTKSVHASHSRSPPMSSGFAVSPAACHLRASFGL